MAVPSYVHFQTKEVHITLSELVFMGVIRVFMLPGKSWRNIIESHAFSSGLYGKY